MPIDDITLARMKQSYLSEVASTKAELWEKVAKKSGVSVPTVRRYSKEGEWDTLREARNQVEGAIAKEVKRVQPKVTVAIGPETFNTDELLVSAIQQMSGEMAGIPGKSKEGLASAMGKLIDLYRRYHPVTMDELVDLALAIPSFDPQEFARKLRERIERRAV